MQNHTNHENIEGLLSAFFGENPYGDTFELAEWMYNHGFEDGARNGADENASR